jgi:CBS domain-containing protein
MRVRELLRRKPTTVVTADPNMSVATAASMLVARGIGTLPVVSGSGNVVGLVSERDLVRAIHEHRDRVPALSLHQVMAAPAPACSGDDSLYDVMSRMTLERLRHLVVLEQGRLAGVLSVGDLVKYRLEQLETEAGILRDYVAAQRAAT